MRLFLLLFLAVVCASCTSSNSNNFSTVGYIEPESFDTQLTHITNELSNDYTPLKTTFYVDKPFLSTVYNRIEDHLKLKGFGITYNEDFKQTYPELAFRFYEFSDEVVLTLLVDKAKSYSIKGVVEGTNINPTSGVFRRVHGER